MVLDASAAVELLLRTPKGLLVRQHVSASSNIHCPYLFDVEVLHVLRKMFRLRTLDAVRAAEALQDLCDLEITRYPHEPFLRRIWSLRDNLSAYDASYVALAESLDVPLFTCDERLGSAPGHSAQVVLL